MATFVNECNHKYQQNDPDINPQNTPNFLPEGVPEFVNTRNHNNSYDKSIGIVTSSLQKDQIKNINARARPTRICKQRGQGAVPRSQHQGTGPGGGAGAGERQAGGDGHPKPFSTFTQPLQDLKKEEEEESAARRGEGDPSGLDDPDDPNDRDPEEEPEELTEEQEDFCKVREMLRTLSLAMEKPIWDHCTQDDPCVMPNIKRTPDITVVIFPDDYEKNISYPIFIGEVLGKKSPGPQYNQRYKGYNAVMQSLVFAPRAYYFEIATIAPSLYILEKNPKDGTITGKKKNYVLAYPSEMNELIKDLCRVFLDELINLRPIAHLSSLCMHRRNYQDFLSPPQWERNQASNSMLAHICPRVP